MLIKCPFTFIYIERGREVGMYFRDSHAIHINKTLHGDKMRFSLLLFFSFQGVPSPIFQGIPFIHMICKKSSNANLDWVSPLDELINTRIPIMDHYVHSTHLWLNRSNHIEGISIMHDERCTSYLNTMHFGFCPRHMLKICHVHLLQAFPTSHTIMIGELDCKLPLQIAIMTHKDYLFYFNIELAKVMKGQNEIFILLKPSHRSLDTQLF